MSDWLNVDGYPVIQREDILAGDTVIHELEGAYREIVVESVKDVPKKGNFRLLDRVPAAKTHTTVPGTIGWAKATDGFWYPGRIDERAAFDYMNADGLYFRFDPAEYTEFVAAEMPKNLKEGK